MPIERGPVKRRVAGLVGEVGVQEGRTRRGGGGEGGDKEAEDICVID